MRLNQTIKSNCHQTMVLTQRMQQSLAILQLSQLELSKLILEEVEKNPLLELEPSYSASSPSSRSDFIYPDTPETISLTAHLLKQAFDVCNSQLEKKLAIELIEQLDEKGFLTLPLTVEQEKILPLLQMLDPPGIFARSCQETFLLQLERAGQQKSLAFQIVARTFDEFLHGRFGKIEKKLGCNSVELNQAIQSLSKLTTRPASSFYPPSAEPIYPDLKAERVGEKWEISCKETLLPKFSLNSAYSHLPGLSKEEKTLIKGFSLSAKWLAQSVARRKHLLLSIGTYLIKTQTAYLTSEGPLTAITPSELGTLFGVHESTISRALADKYIDSPLGMIPLRSLISTQKDPAKQVLKQLIQQENKQNPLTDDQLAEALQKSGLKVARRTVAKYRIECKIGSASVRKRSLNSHQINHVSVA